MDNSCDEGEAALINTVVSARAMLFLPHILYRRYFPACLRQDGNMGLVKQVVHALARRKIMQLTHTYITLSLRGKHWCLKYVEL